MTNTPHPKEALFRVFCVPCAMRRERLVGREAREIVRTHNDARHNGYPRATMEPESQSGALGAPKYQMQYWDTSVDGWVRYARYGNPAGYTHDEVTVILATLKTALPSFSFRAAGIGHTGTITQ